MTWTTPKTFVSGDVLTASEMNTYVRDNTNDLNTRLTPFESGGWIPLGSGSGTASSVAMSEPTAGYDAVRAIVQSAQSSTDTISATVNAVSSGYVGQYYGIASDAVSAGASLDYGSTTSWTLYESTSLSVPLIDIMVITHASGSGGYMNALLMSNSSTGQRHASGYVGTITSITSLTVNWNESAAYRYTIWGLNF